MEAKAVLVHEYMLNLKRQRFINHRIASSKDGPCSGLSFSEWKLPVRQKNTFSKSKRYACTRLWNHKHVPTSQGFKSLTIKTI
jgi:hypothetical protein